VRILDDAMNNTSVILLFDVRGKRFLFSGDAQYENLAYELSKPNVEKLLRGVNLYKVGHHGSLNATPKKSLWPLLTGGANAGAKGRLVTLLSTLGKAVAQTRFEVPRRATTELDLVEIVVTHKYKSAQLCRTRTIF
jgi:hypothetical protein